MPNPFKAMLNKIAEKFSDDPSKMLVITGVAGWVLSSLAQISAVLFNSKISKDQKSFLIPQEVVDAVVNIGAFFLITQMTRKYVGKLFSTGKIASNGVRDYLHQNKQLYADKVGKLDFNLDTVFSKNKNSVVAKEYFASKNIGTTVATIGAGILSSNIITPILRNSAASKMQKNYLKNTSQTDMNIQSTNNTTFKSYGMRI